MAERVVASVRAVVRGRTIEAPCPCGTRLEIELPPVGLLVGALEDHRRADVPLLGQREWEVFRLLRDSSPRWVEKSVLTRLVWEYACTRQSVTTAVREIRRKLAGTPWQLERRGGHTAFYRVVPAE